MDENIKYFDTKYEDNVIGPLSPKVNQTLLSNLWSEDNKFIGYIYVKQS